MDFLIWGGLLTSIMWTIFRSALITSFVGVCSPRSGWASRLAGSVCNLPGQPKAILLAMNCVSSKGFFWVYLPSPSGN